MFASYFIFVFLVFAYPLIPIIHLFISGSTHSQPASENFCASPMLVFAAERLQQHERHEQAGKHPSQKITAVAEARPPVWPQQPCT